MSIIAVYFIADEISKKFYIGSTNNLQRRINEHKQELRNNTHYNKALQELYNNKAKLTKNDVILIRERFDSGEIYSEIHKDYSFVKLITIKRVCNRETWKNI